jgi:hypothetical protein
MKRTLIVAVFALAFAWVLPADADSWKNESGRDWRKGGCERGEVWHDGRCERRKERWRHVRSYKIPYGHQPAPGECRDWDPHLPPGQQPPPYRC